MLFIVAFRFSRIHISSTPPPPPSRAAARYPPAYFSIPGRPPAGSAAACSHHSTALPAGPSLLIVIRHHHPILAALPVQENGIWVVVFSFQPYLRSSRPGTRRPRNNPAVRCAGHPFACHMPSSAGNHPGSLEVIRLVADDIAKQQALVDHVAIIETGYGGHSMGAGAACSG